MTWAVFCFSNNKTGCVTLSHATSYQFKHNNYSMHVNISSKIKVLKRHEPGYSPTR